MMRKFLAKTSVVDASGRVLDYTATVRSMDRDLCKVIEQEAVDSDQTFYNRYLELHKAKHRETFEPVYRDG